jgi:hypothetical protein
VKKKEPSIATLPPLACFGCEMRQLHESRCQNLARYQPMGVEIHYHLRGGYNNSTLYQQINTLVLMMMMMMMMMMMLLLLLLANRTDQRSTNARMLVYLRTC